MSQSEKVGLLPGLALQIHCAVLTSYAATGYFSSLRSKKHERQNRVSQADYSDSTIHV
jgi:hypothetical protein